MLDETGWVIMRRSIGLHYGVFDRLYIHTAAGVSINIPKRLSDNEKF